MEALISYLASWLTARNLIIYFVLAITPLMWTKYF